MQNGHGAESLLVRFTHSDWQTERIDPLYIERLDTDGSPPEPLTEADMAAAFQRASQSMYDRTASWIQLADRWWTMAPNNSVSTMRMTPGGLVGQYSAFGSFDLSDDGAMLIEFGDTGAPYMGIQLGNRWFVSMDYENHTSTLNMHQLRCRNDPAKCYVIIAKNDPGVANWLDTTGHQEGLVFMRWQGLKTPPEDEHQPRVTVLDREALAAFVAGLPAMNPEQRKAAIEARRRSVHERFGG